jgi:hypothetical protein
VGFGLRLVEIRVGIDEQQPIAPPPTQSQHRAEHDRAIATEHDREVAGVEHGCDSLGKGVRVVTQAGRVEHSCHRVAPRIVRRRRNAACSARTDRISEPSTEECSGQILDAPREQPQHGRRLDDRVRHGPDHAASRTIPKVLRMRTEEDSSAFLESLLPELRPRGEQAKAQLLHP